METVEGMLVEASVAAGESCKPASKHHPARLARRPATVEDAALLGSLKLQNFEEWSGTLQVLATEAAIRTMWRASP